MNKISVYESFFGSYVGDFIIVNNRNQALDLWNNHQKVFLIHSPDKCEGHFCPFHNPSNHFLKFAPMNVRLDKDGLIERVCEHGVGHDDPDSVAYLTSLGIENYGHGCCGCCSKCFKVNEYSIGEEQREVFIA